MSTHREGIERTATSELCFWSRLFIRLSSNPCGNIKHIYFSAPHHPTEVRPQAHPLAPDLDLHPRSCPPGFLFAGSPRCFPGAGYPGERPAKAGFANPVIPSLHLGQGLVDDLYFLAGLLIQPHQVLVCILLLGPIRHISLRDIHLLPLILEPMAHLQYFLSSGKKLIVQFSSYMLSEHGCASLHKLRLPRSRLCSIVLRTCHFPLGVIYKK